MEQKEKRKRKKEISRKKKRERKYNMPISRQMKEVAEGAELTPRHRKLTKKVEEFIEEQEKEEEAKRRRKEILEKTRLEQEDNMRKLGRNQCGKDFIKKLEKEKEKDEEESEDEPQAKEVVEAEEEERKEKEKEEDEDMEVVDEDQGRPEKRKRKSSEFDPELSKIKIVHSFWFQDQRCFCFYGVCGHVDGGREAGGAFRRGNGGLHIRSANLVSHMNGKHADVLASFPTDNFRANGARAKQVAEAQAAARKRGSRAQ